MYAYLTGLCPLASVGASPVSLVERLPLNSSLITASVETRIVGGQQVARGEVPYLVSLQDARWTPDNPRHYCGGSIHDATTVVTAAHCVSPYLKDYYGVISCFVAFGFQLLGFF